MRLIFIRHGDPDYENDTVTERGRTEAEALRSRVNSLGADKILCSPLGRARATANIALFGSGRSYEVVDWLEEFYIPVVDPQTGARRIAWDFMPAFWTAIPELYDKDGWQNSAVMRTGKVAEGLERVKAGIDGVVAGYGYRRDGRIYRTAGGSDGCVLMFCHLGVQFVALSYLLGLSAPVMWQSFFVAPSSVTVLETEEREGDVAAFRCKMLGDVSHLYAAGIIPSDSGFFVRNRDK